MSTYKFERQSWSALQLLGKVPILTEHVEPECKEQENESTDPKDKQYTIQGHPLSVKVIHLGMLAASQDSILSVALNILYV